MGSVGRIVVMIASTTLESSICQDYRRSEGMGRHLYGKTILIPPIPDMEQLEGIIVLYPDFVWKNLSGFCYRKNADGVYHWDRLSKVVGVR